MEAGNGVGGPVDAKFEALAVIAEIGGAREDGASVFAFEGGAGFGFERTKDWRDLRRTGREHNGAGELATQVGIENAECGERAGSIGNENATDAEGLRECAGVERAGTAEGDEREVARIVAAFDGDAAEGRLHTRVGHAEDAFGEVFESGEGPGGYGGESAAGAGFVEMHRSAKKVVGMEAAEDEVCVSDGGAIATTVACGSGHGARGLGADLESIGEVHPSQRAATRAGGVDVEHGHANGKTGNLAFGAGGWFASSV